MKSALIQILLSLSALILTNCSNPGEIAGGAGGTETSNGISGIIRDTDDRAVADARVLLLTEDHNPYREPTLPKRSVVRREITDDQGWFRFDSVSPGTYSIQSSHPDNESVLLLQDITVTDDEGADSLECLLKEPGSLIIHISELAAAEGDYIYIPGTSIFMELNAASITAGQVSISGIPPAVYDEVILVKNGLLPGTNLIREAVTVSEGADVILGPFSSWSVRKKVTINTGTGGAAVAEDIHKFPLVLRLSSAHFDFTRAQPDGGDLRFTKSDGINSLPYEIESWDYVNGQAVVWVRLDTVYSNNDSQFIYIYTGHDAAPARSSGPVVFDTAAGFTGVWHMHNSPLDGTEDSTGVMKDASGHAMHGHSRGAMTTDNSADAVVGPGLLFDGTDDYVALDPDPELNITGAISISAWVRLSAYPESDTARIFDKRKTYALQLTPEGSVLFWIGGQEALTSDSGSIGLDQWYHVAGVADGNTHTIYINGQQAVSVPGLGINIMEEPLAGIGWAPGDWDPITDYFNGMMDEVRLSSAARSVDWMKLSYETQKENSNVVRIE
jgi:hypothetical protein